MIGRWYQSWVIFVVILIFYLWGLWGLSVPLTGDQKTYLSIAMEMWEQSSFLIPSLFGEANFLKPPFQYWMTLLGWKIFGFGTFGALFPSVMALGFATYLVRRIFLQVIHSDSAAANRAAVFFAASLGTMTYGTTAQMEIWVVALYLGAWFLLMQRKVFLSLALVGVLAWVKGPLYSVLWVLGLGLFQVLSSKSSREKTGTLLLAIALGSLVGLSWYGLAALTHSEQVIAVFFKQENLSKIGTHQGSPFSLWGEFLYSLLPWLLIFLGSFGVVSWRKSWWDRQSRWFPFLMGYALLPALFFTFFPYRVNTYLYLLTPIFAMALAKLPNEPVLPRLSKIFLRSVSVLFGGALLAILIRLTQGNWISAFTGAPLILMIGFWVFLHFQVNLNSLGLVCLCWVNLIRMGGIEIGERDLSPLRSMLSERSTHTPLAYALNGRDIWHEFGMISVAIRQPIALFESPESRVQFLDQGGWMIFEDESEANSVAPGLECKPWVRLKRRMKFPFRELILEGAWIDDPRFQRTFQVCHRT